MSALAMQTVIAKICVDAVFRQSFLRNPDEALQACGLTPQESAAVKALDTEAVQSYADSLVNKKMTLVIKWFPLSLAALRIALSLERVRHIVFKYGYESPRSGGELGGEWVRSEFVRFRDYLRTLVDSRVIDVPYFTDVLEFEATRQLMSQDPATSMSLEGRDSPEEAAHIFASADHQNVRPQLGSHVQIRRFDCDIVSLIAQTESGSAAPAAPVKASTWLMFVKKPGTGKVVVQTLSPALSDVLDLCDGTRTVTEVLGVIVARHATIAGLSASDVKSDCLAVLEQFYAARLINLQ